MPVRRHDRPGHLSRDPYAQHLNHPARQAEPRLMPQYAASQLACLREREELKRSWQHRHRHYLPESTNLHRSAAGNVVIHGTSYSAGSMWSEVVVAIGESGGEPEI